MEELRHCLFCGHVSQEKVGACPTCQRQRRFLTLKQIQINGWLQIIIGLFLIVLMGTITVNLLPSLLHIAHNFNSPTFTGTNEQANMILLLFSAVIAFGLASSLTGLWLLIKKRMNKWLYIAVLAIYAFLVGFVVYFNHSF